MAETKAQKEPKAEGGKKPYRRKVRAILTGYIGMRRRREGDVFIITDPKQFSEKWMEDADKPKAEEKIEEIGGKDGGDGKEAADESVI